MKQDAIRDGLVGWVVEKMETCDMTLEKSKYTVPGIVHPRKLTWNPKNCWFGSIFLLFQGGHFQVSGVRFLGFVVSTEIIRKWCDTVKKDLHLLLLLLDGHAGHFVCAAGSLSRLGNLERCMTPSTEQSRLFFEAVETPNWSWVAFYLACFLLVPVLFFLCF